MRETRQQRDRAQGRALTVDERRPRLRRHALRGLRSAAKDHELEAQRLDERTKVVHGLLVVVDDEGASKESLAFVAMVVEDKRCSRRVMPRADLILLYLRAPTRLMFSTPDCISSRVAFGNYYLSADHLVKGLIST